MSKDDIEDYDSLEEYIRDKMNEPTEITAEDLEPPTCDWCGKELVGDSEVIVWDVLEKGTDSIYFRYRYCSEEHKRKDMMNPPSERPADANPERLHEDEMEAIQRV